MRRDHTPKPGRPDPEKRRSARAHRLATPSSPPPGSAEGAPGAPERASGGSSTGIEGPLPGDDEDYGRRSKRGPSLTPSELERCLPVVLRLYFVRRLSVSEVGRYVRERMRIGLKRPDVYRVLEEAFRRQMLGIHLPETRRLVERLCARLSDVREESIEVVGRSLRDPDEDVALRAAALARDRILALFREGAERVHVGLGIGRMSRTFAGELARLLQETERLPALVFHAMVTSDEPCLTRETLPAFSAFFDDLPAAIEFRAFPGPAVGEEGWRRARRRLVEDVQIVVTSLGDAEDEQCYPRRVLRLAGEEALCESMLAAGWRGDVQMRCYGDGGELATPPALERLSLCRLEDLRRIAADPERLVLLMCGPGRRKGKARALAPLLTRPELGIWSQLVVDEETLRAVLDLVEGVGART